MFLESILFFKNWKFQNIFLPSFGDSVAGESSHAPQSWAWGSILATWSRVEENRVSQLDLTGDSWLQAARSSTRAKHARSWSVMLAGALQDKIGQLAVLLSRGWISRLSQAASPSREPPLFWKTWRFTFFSHPSINTPYTHKRMRASRENFERETLE